MKLLFIGTICDELFFDKLIKSSFKFKPSIAGQTFERMIVEGISLKGEVEILSAIPVGTYPKYPHVFCRKEKDFNLEKMKISYIPFINILILKQVTVFLYTLWFVFKWLFANRSKEKAILLNVVYPPTSIPALLWGKIFSCPVTVLVPDISTFRFEYSPTVGYIKNLLSTTFKYLCETLDSKFDGYILLTEDMNVLVNSQKKPYVIVEGMTKKDFRNSNVNADAIVNNKGSIVMYAGSLREKYGISKLIESFLKLQNKDYELWIFGSGDYEDTVKKISKENTKIKYFGLVTHSEIIEYESKATLLINPRPSIEEFTKYSFPSKTIEYMASGTPLLTTQLPGIPEEYWKYVYTFNDESVNGMAQTIDRILCKTSEELNAFGEKARKYIINNKNYIVQTEVILDFLEKLISKTKNYK